MSSTTARFGQAWSLAMTDHNAESLITGPFRVEKREVVRQHGFSGVVWVVIGPAGEGWKVGRLSFEDSFSAYDLADNMNIAYRMGREGH